MKAATLMLVGVAAVNVGNYLFHVIAARDLGPSGYGDLVALLTLSSLVTLPLAALQIVVSRYVAHHTVTGTDDEARRLNRHIVLGTTVVSAAITVGLLLCLPVIKSTLSITSPAAIALTALLTLPTALTPVVWGVAQGLQRFGLLALSMAVGTTARVIALVAFLFVGLTTWSAILATLVSMVVSFALPIVPLRPWFARPSSRASSAKETTREEGRLLRAIVPAAVSLLAFTSLTQTDVLAANVAFGDTTSGVYGAASLIGRIILYLPTAVVAVLLPKVAARRAANRTSEDLLGLSLLATFTFCAVSTLLYGLAASPIVSIAFGAKYAGADGLLLPFGIAMTGLALANVLLYYHLGRGDHVFSWLLGGSAVAQVAAFAVFHASPRWIVADTIAVTAALLCAHELFCGRAMMRAMRGGVSLVRGARA